MPEKTDAQKRAQKAYMEKFVRVEIRMTAEQRIAIQAHAEAQGQSVNAYINAAIDEKMAQEAAGSPASRIDRGIVSLPSETEKAASTDSKGRAEGISAAQTDKLEEKE